MTGTIDVPPSNSNHDNYPNDPYDLLELIRSLVIEHWNVDIRGSGNVVIKLSGKFAS